MKKLKRVWLILLLPAAIAMPVLSLVVSGLCYVFSCRIFQKKDLA